MEGGVTRGGWCYPWTVDEYIGMERVHWEGEVSAETSGTNGARGVPRGPGQPIWGNSKE